MKNIHLHIKNPDTQALEQFNACCAEPYVKAAALMPDAHSGFVAPIGSVLATQGFVVPSWVGFDIGCGLIALKLSGKDLIKNVEKNREKIYDSVVKKIPMGAGKSISITNIV